MVFHRAAVAMDTWMALTRAVRTAWRVIPGDLEGRLVMLACGIDQPSREVREGDVSALLVEDPRCAKYLDHQLMTVKAQTLGRYVFARETLSDRTVAHEMEHVRQWRRFGPLLIPLYGLSSGLALLRRQHPYWANRFEQAARMREEDCARES